MQLDPDFASRLRAGERKAVASTGLAEGELALLRSASPAALRADREGRRRAQLLRNATGEFALSATAEPPGFERGFPSSPEFHRAIAGDQSLPLAFAAYGLREARRGRPAWRALLMLEAGMARARRSTRTAVSPPRGGFALAPTARLLSLPCGTFAHAERVRGALDRGSRPPRAPALGPAHERVLVIAGETPGPYGLRPVHVEPLEPQVADFLARTEPGVDSPGLLAFARAHALDPSAVEAVAHEYAKEGVLIHRHA
jgi:hypothetical protein